MCIIFFWAGDLILISGCEIGFWCLCLKKLLSAFFFFFTNEFKFQSWGGGGSWERVSCALSNFHSSFVGQMAMEIWRRNYSFVKMGFSFQIW